jgi:transcriptional regulator with PAS, ATPase and Fis domain
MTRERPLRAMPTPRQAMDNRIRNEKHSETEKDERFGCKSLYAIRKQHIEHVLKLAEGDIDRAADILEISVPELHRWMTKLRIRL